MRKGTGGIIFAKKIYRGEKITFNFIREKHRSTASGELNRRQAVSGHGIVAGQRQDLASFQSFPTNSEENDLAEVQV